MQQIVLLASEPITRQWGNSTSNPSPCVHCHTSTALSPATRTSVSFRKLTHIQEPVKIGRCYPSHDTTKNGLRIGVPAQYGHSTHFRDNTSRFINYGNTAVNCIFNCGSNETPYRGGAHLVTFQRTLTSDIKHLQQYSPSVTSPPLSKRALSPLTTTMAAQTPEQELAERNRLPTLLEVLGRRTLAPVDLFSFYIYMRDQQRSVDYLDFW